MPCPSASETLICCSCVAMAKAGNKASSQVVWYMPLGASGQLGKGSYGTARAAWGTVELNLVAMKEQHVGPREYLTEMRVMHKYGGIPGPG